MKKLIRVFLFLFLLANISAGIHAYKFTHFSQSADSRTSEGSVNGTWDKMMLAAFGVDNPRPENVRQPGQPFETIILPGTIKLEAWLMRADSAKGTVILFHGYAGKKSDMLDRAEVLHRHHYNVLLADFRGSGGSEGNSTTIGYREADDVLACYEYAVQKELSENIFLFGTSMGAAAILKCLNDHPELKPSGIILECPFGSMYQTVCARFRMLGYPEFPMAGVLIFWGGALNGFWGFSHNPVKYAKKVKCPALLLYGEKDTRVSRKEIDAIYQNLPGKRQLLTFPESGHESYLLKYGEEWTDELTRFLTNSP